MSNKIRIPSNYTLFRLLRAFFILPRKEQERKDHKKMEVFFFYTAVGIGKKRGKYPMAFFRRGTHTTQLGLLSFLCLLGRGGGGEKNVQKKK